MENQQVMTEIKELKEMVRESNKIITEVRLEQRTSSVTLGHINSKGCDHAETYTQEIKGDIEKVHKRIDKFRIGGWVGVLIATVVAFFLQDIK